MRWFFACVLLMACWCLPAQGWADEEAPPPPGVGGHGQTPSASGVSPRLDAGTRRSIHRVLRRGEAVLQRCLARVAKDVDAAAGRLRIKITIDTSGEVLDVRTLRDDVGHGLGTCVEQRVRQWRFPSLDEPLTLIQNYSFDG